MGKGRSFLLALAALLLLSGCGGHTAGQRDGRETVTVALWSDQLNIAPLSTTALKAHSG